MKIIILSEPSSENLICCTEEGERKKLKQGADRAKNAGR
jgi:hypothetical protein